MGLLDNVQSGIKPPPPKLCVYGPGGIGKTTFAANAPSPLLLQTELGHGLLSTPRIKVDDYGAFSSILDELITEQHQYRTLVIDSLDHLEPMIWGYVCVMHGKGDIEDFGYGQGYSRAEKVWRDLFSSIDELIEVKRMAFILIAHAEVKAFADPEGESYDRYQPKLNKKASAVMVEWCNDVLLATYEKYTRKTNDEKRAIAVGDGRRVIRTEERPAQIAKNRWGLPYEIDLSWDAYWSAVQQCKAAANGQS